MSIKLKYIITIILETILLIASGIILNNLNAPQAVNVVAFILLLLEVVFVCFLSYKKFNGKLKPVAILAFVLLGLFLYGTVIAKEFTTIPKAILGVYEFLMGYLCFNACTAVSKTVSNKSVSRIFVVIAMVMFVLSVITGFLALFGIAK